MSLPSDGHRYEVIGGELCVSPSPGFEHQGVVVNLAHEFMRFLKRTGAGICRVAPTGVFITSDTYVEPDILILRTERAHVATPRGLVGPPDLVVEVLSASTVNVDQGRKLRLYDAIGVDEYWLVDSAQRRVRILARSDGRLGLVTDASSGSVESPTVLPGFRATLDDVYWRIL